MTKHKNDPILRGLKAVDSWINDIYKEEEDFKVVHKRKQDKEVIKIVNNYNFFNQQKKSEDNLSRFVYKVFNSDGKLLLSKIFTGSEQRLMVDMMNSAKGFMKNNGFRLWFEYTDTISGECNEISIFKKKRNERRNY